MTTITGVDLLPRNPFAGTTQVALIITDAVSSYYKLSGVNLDQITNVSWYPKDPRSVKFEVRQLILADNTNTVGTFMIRIIDNYLDICDRAGKISFRLQDGTNITFPVTTLGPASIGRLWHSPYEGLDTGS